MKRKTKKEIPEGFSIDDIKTETSICTGEKTIGFYDRASKKLCYAELVNNDNDVAEFYEKYGLKFKG